jgi:hypothetical protein
MAEGMVRVLLIEGSQHDAPVGAVLMLPQRVPKEKKIRQ